MSKSPFYRTGISRSPFNKEGEPTPDDYFKAVGGADAPDPLNDGVDAAVVGFDAAAAINNVADATVKSIKSKNPFQNWDFNDIESTNAMNDFFDIKVTDGKGNPTNISDQATPGSVGQKPPSKGGTGEVTQADIDKFPALGNSKSNEDARIDGVSKTNHNIFSKNFMETGSQKIDRIEETNPRRAERIRGRKNRKADRKEARQERRTTKAVGTKDFQEKKTQNQKRRLQDRQTKVGKRFKTTKK